MTASGSVWIQKSKFCEVSAFRNFAKGKRNIDDPYLFYTLKTVETEILFLLNFEFVDVMMNCVVSSFRSQD